MVDLSGGWAIEAFTGVARPHKDVDVTVFRRDVGAVREHFRGRYDLWAAGNGTLRPGGASAIARYLCPELVLAHKFRLRRPEDDADLEAVLPRLGNRRQTWLRELVARSDPDHPWNAMLRSGRTPR